MNIESSPIDAIIPFGRLGLVYMAMEGLLRLMLPLPVLLSSFSSVLLDLDAAIHQSTQCVTLNTAKLQLDVWVKSLAIIV